MMTTMVSEWTQKTKRGERNFTLSVIPYLDREGAWSGYCWLTESECCGPFRDDDEAREHGIAWMKANGHTQAGKDVQG